MANVSTARILARQAIRTDDWRECVDWAIGMLEAGHDTREFRILAGLIAPFNSFEVAALRDRALEQLGVGGISGMAAIRLFAVELLRAALAGKVGLVETVAQLKDLCIAAGHAHELFDFYLLHFAHGDLERHGSQRYWTGATRDNIRDIMRERAEAFVAGEAPDG